MNESPLQPQIRRVILLSPIAVIATGQLVVRMIDRRLGPWGWALAIAGYWVALGILIACAGGRQAVSRWLRPSRGTAAWPVLAVICAVVPTLPMLPESWRFLLQTRVWLPTMAFVLINPALEEAYWRGVLLDASVRWSPRVAVTYSSVLFTLNHLWFTHFVVAARNPVVWAFQFVLSVVLALVYLKTQSLRWPIVAHLLANVLSPTVAMMLNLYVP